MSWIDKHKHIKNFAVSRVPNQISYKLMMPANKYDDLEFGIHRFLKFLLKNLIRVWPEIAESDDSEQAYI